NLSHKSVGAITSRRRTPDLSILNVDPRIGRYKIYSAKNIDGRPTNGHTSRFDGLSFHNSDRSVPAHGDRFSRSTTTRNRPPSTARIGFCRFVDSSLSSVRPGRARRDDRSNVHVSRAARVLEATRLSDCPAPDGRLASPGEGAGTATTLGRHHRR